MLADLGTVQLLWSSDSSATPGVSELSSRNKAWQPPEVGVLLLCVGLCLWDAAVWRGVSVDLLPFEASSVVSWCLGGWQKWGWSYFKSSCSGEALRIGAAW